MPRRGPISRSRSRPATTSRCARCGIVGGVRRAIRRGAQRLPVTRRKVPVEFLARRFAEEAEREPLERHLAWFGALGPAASEVCGLDRELSVRPLWRRLEAIDDPVKRMLVFDFATYLGENLLTKLDRASMLSSLEARAPFLDPLVVELALGLPLRANLRALGNKRLLRRAG